ncbi:MAG: biotin transporter BioY [Blautia sp.]|nr:biotin transporter BioY [Blautia sp.]
MENANAATGKTKDIVLIGMFAVIMAICSWISIPTAVPFTLQTMGVFLAVGVLGGKRGSMTVLIYILLGLVGVPVFHGFTGGPGILFGNTGGYIIGFLGSALVMWLVEKVAGGRLGKWVRILSMLAGLCVCYTFGTIWFVFVYTRNVGTVGLMTVLGWCVFPFIIPDLIKIMLAFMLSNRLRQYV